MDEFVLATIWGGDLVSPSELIWYTDYQIVTFEGSGISVVGQSALPASGTITSIEVADGHGPLLFTVTGLSLPATQFADWYWGGDWRPINPTIFAGDDVLTGGVADDRLHGFDGNDTISGEAGANYLRGDDGNDSIQGGGGFDDINGNKGDDTIDGGAAGGGDWLVGGQGNDSIVSHVSDDILYGNLGSDTLVGGSGSEIIRGGQADDSLSGGAGADWMSGDRGSDTVAGGAGADIFHTFVGAGIDRVTDFSVAEGDRVMLDPGTAYTVVQSGADTLIDMGNGDQMILVGVQMSTLPSGWIFGV